MTSVSMASVSADPQNVYRFLQRLATDDAFRAQVEQDPDATLKASGIVLSVPPHTIKLPPKADLQALLANAGTSSATTVTPQAGAHFVAFVAFLAFLA
jgi:putative modified peptide